MIREHAKLVRDHIPEQIRAEGREPIVRVLGDAEFLTCLKEKLSEETAEYLREPNLEELADILEIVEALCIANGASWADLLRAKEKKARTHGAFAKRIFSETYAKLVRDNVPDLIRAEGREAPIRVMNEGEYLYCLREKLTEEVAEYLGEPNLEELADALEVIHALCAATGTDWGELLHRKEEKARQNGRFAKKLYLEAYES